MIRYKKHLEFIRTLPCVKTGIEGNNDPAHLRKGTDGGMGLKPSDCYVLPLCHTEHHRQHQIGEASFWHDLDAVKEFALFLYENTGDYEICRKEIIKRLGTL